MRQTLQGISARRHVSSSAFKKRLSPAKGLRSHRRQRLVARTCVFAEEAATTSGGAAASAATACAGGAAATPSTVCCTQRPDAGGRRCHRKCRRRKWLTPPDASLRRRPRPGRAVRLPQLQLRRLFVAEKTATAAAALKSAPPPLPDAKEAAATLAPGERSSRESDARGAAAVQTRADPSAVAAAGAVVVAAAVGLVAAAATRPPPRLAQRRPLLGLLLKANARAMHALRPAPHALRRDRLSARPAAASEQQQQPHQGRDTEGVASKRRGNPHAKEKARGALRQASFAHLPR